MTEIAANIIAESMYAQCVGGNEHLLLEAFAYHWKKGSAKIVEDQQRVIEG